MQKGIMEKPTNTAFRQKNGIDEMKHTANLQVLAGKAINANRHQAVRHYGVIVAVCLCATVMVGLTGISV